MTNFSAELNPEQLDVVLHGDGPCLVLAGAGSGKTRTITYRVAYLLEQGVKPEEILLVTFTNKAASEMKRRVAELVQLSSRPQEGSLSNRIDGQRFLPATAVRRGPAVAVAEAASRNDSNVLPWSGTFHHIGYRLLRQYAPLVGYKNNFTVLDSDDSASLIKLCIKDVKKEGEQGARFPSAAVVNSIISFSRNAQIKIEQVMEDRYDQWLPFSSQIVYIARQYERRKKEANAMDFDDLLTNLLLLLSQSSPNPSAAAEGNREPSPSQWRGQGEDSPNRVLAKLANQFRYVLVDEYQDTNKIQAAVIDRLASVHKNILVVGDDAQSIYSFRAADIQNILQFEKQYLGVKIFKLETNYRSTKQILDVANSVIENNATQYKKNLRVADSEPSPTVPLPMGEGGDPSDGATVVPLSSRRGARGEVSPLPILQPQMDSEAEATYVAQQIEKLLKEGTPATEVAVLFRAAFHSQALEVELVSRGIEYDYRGGVRFFERAHVKDILSYLRIMNNLADTAAWLRVLMHEEGIGPAAAEKVISAVRALTVIPNPLRRGEESLSQSPNGGQRSLVGASLARDDSWDAIAEIGEQVLSGRAAGGWDNFLNIWNALVNSVERSPSALVLVLLKTPYKEYLEAEYVDSKDRLLDLAQLAEFAKRYENLEEFLAAATLQESFRTIASETSPPAPPLPPERDPASRRWEERGTNGDVNTVVNKSKIITAKAGSRFAAVINQKSKIILSTIHQAKGLEWSAVFILNLSSGAFPSERSMREANGLEEERRLFYVAVTRAKQNLFLTYPMAGGSFGDFLSGPSMFIDEIAPGLVEDHSLLLKSSSVFNDPGAGVSYVDEDEDIPFTSTPRKIKKGSFLADIEDL